MLATVLMVKNEGQTIASTLLPLIEGKVQNFFVLDTGSSDDTVAVAHHVLKNARVTYSLVQEEFIDFATSRNRALDLAEQYFPNIPFFLMLDAEWCLYGVDKLLSFCEQQIMNTTPLFLIKLMMNHGAMEFYSPRLFRNSAKIRFSGVVHEVPCLPTQAKVPDEIYIEFNPSDQSAQKSEQRWSRDLDLLLKQYESALEPEPRTVFYLAQTYECLGQLHEAYKYYTLRSSMQGFDEETFVATYRSGRIAAQLSNDDPQFSWEIAQQHFHHAFALQPHRIEPLVCIADYYWPSNIPLCYLYARYACDAAYPEDDLLFIEKTMYDYTRFEILSRCAWYMGEHQLGLEATKRALLIQPDTPHLLNNLSIYENELEKRKDSSS